MRIRQRFEIIGLSIIIFILILGGALLTIQLLTNPHHYYDWTTILFISVLYIVLVIGLSIIIFLIRVLSLIHKEPTIKDKILSGIKYIRYSILGSGLVSLGILPKFYVMADGSDAPGVFLIGIGISFLPWGLFIIVETIIDIMQNYYHN